MLTHDRYIQHEVNVVIRRNRVRGPKNHNIPQYIE